MKYGLERRVRDGRCHARFTLYGVCSNCSLLERIRAGQEHPSEWRVVVVQAPLAKNDPEKWLKAG